MTKQFNNDAINRFNNGNEVLFKEIDSEYFVGKSFYIQYEAEFKPGTYKIEFSGGNPDNSKIYKDLYTADRAGMEYLRESYKYSTELPSKNYISPDGGIVIRRATVIKNALGKPELVHISGSKIKVKNQSGFRSGR